MTHSTHHPSPLTITKSTAGNFRHNRASRVVDDLESLGVPFDQTTRVLLARGVFKAFADRRSLLSLIDDWKYVIRGESDNIHRLRAMYHDSPLVFTGPRTSANAPLRDQRIRLLAEGRARLNTLTTCRNQLLRIAKSPTWQVADNDSAKLVVAHMEEEERLGIANAPQAHTTTPWQCFELFDDYEDTTDYPITGLDPDTRAYLQSTADTE